jgi:secreted trypsin-like serine protease
MRKSLVAATIAGAALAAGLVAAPAQADVSPNIIGGGSASNIPYGAQIYWTNAGSSNGFECSGTIIASQWVLTARHCQNNPGMYVLVGSLNLGQGTRATVDRQVPSPNGDILLVHLSTAINTTFSRLASADPATGSTNQIYGWGRTQGSNPPSPVLKTANVRVTGHSSDAFGGSAIASTGINGAAWHGDSGGPQVSGGLQVGVCSTGSNSGSNPQGTQNYASVATSRSFIRSTAGV